MTVNSSSLRSHWHGKYFAAVLLTMNLAAGCSSRPASIPVVDVDPSAASRRAIDNYDRDADGLLSSMELQAVPGILKRVSLYDSDGDGHVSASEIASRIELWEKQRMGVRGLSVRVTLDRKPLAGAQIELIPEEYLGPNCKPARGVTNNRGVARMNIATEDLPPQFVERRIRGVQGGVYRIKVTHSQRKIPVRYNSDSTLGEEIATDTVHDAIQVDLSS
jgi:hypothetical protein